MKSLIAIVVVFLTICLFVDATYCKGVPGRYCDECCCYSTGKGDHCCSCTLVWWAIFLIVLGIIIFIAIAICIGVWRRRVYVARRATTVYTAVPPSQVVTQYATY